MQVRILRTALFLGWLLSISAPMQGAALNNTSLQGNYFFVLQKIDTSVLGFSFTTAQGAMTFDQNGKIAVSGFINRNGAVQSLSSSGTYNLSSIGAVEVALSDPAFSVGGKVSFDLSSVVATNASTGSSFIQETFLATKQSPVPLFAGLLNGRYFLSERTITAGGSPQFESAAGTIRFDGLGGCSLNLSSNRNGSVVSVTGQGSYLIGSDGSVLLSLPGRTSPVKLGFTSDGNTGVGATIGLQSSTTHDVYAITRASSDGLGNAALNGSYEIVVSSANISAGFSTAEASADYFGDGTVFYQTAQSSAPVAGNVSIELDGSLQLSGFPSAPVSFQGGAGVSGHAFLAAALSDPAVHRFLMAIRTPSQPAAVANAASFSAGTALSPGALLTVFGRNLARQTAEASSLPLPRAMGGVRVRIGGIEAPLRFVSPFQLNVQVPFELQPSPTNLTIVLDGVESGPLAVTVNSAGPGIFTLSSDGTGGGIFQHGVDFTPVTKSSPARPRETVLIYATGLGAVLPVVASGAAGPADPPASASASVSVRINGIDAATPDFAGLAPGFAGLYQVNVQIPAQITTAGDVSVVVTASGVASNTVTLPIAP
jgi:uncharacterized protein (TIGR03437 family)